VENIINRGSLVLPAAAPGAIMSPYPCAVSTSVTNSWDRWHGRASWKYYDGYILA